MRTVRHDPDDEAEKDAVRTPEGEPGELIDPDDMDGDDEGSEEVIPG